MNEYRIRDLLAMPEENLWDLPEEVHVVIFDDGTVVSSTEETITTVYMLFIGSKYPKTFLSKEWHVANTGFDGGVYLDTLGKIAWTAFDSYKANGEGFSTEELADAVMETQERYYNAFSVRPSRHVTSFAMHEMLEVVNHPRMKAINANIEPTMYGIEHVAYRDLRELLLDPNEFEGNGLVRSTRLKISPIDQVTQIIGPPGFNTDINKSIHPYPLMHGFMFGITDLYGSMTHSRSGSKALGYNKELLAVTETLNREMQLMTQSISTLYKGIDCGTTIYLEIPVLKELLGTMSGVYYLKDDGSWDWLRGNEKHLIGRNIKIRSPLGCIHPDPGGVCEACYGKLADAIPEGTNIGHEAAKETGDVVTSRVLKTKHMDSTAHIDPLELGSAEEQFLVNLNDSDVIYFKEYLKHRRFWITFVGEEASGINDLSLVENSDVLTPELVSTLTKILIEVDGADEFDGLQREILTVSVFNRRSHLTADALKFIKEKGWAFTDEKRPNVRVEFTGFDVSRPFVVLPAVHVDMIEHKTQFEHILFSSGTKTRSPFRDDEGRPIKQSTGPQVLRDFANPKDALIFFALSTHSQINVNLVHKTLLLMSMLARDPMNGDYTIPKPAIDGIFVPQGEIARGRSLSPTMAYRGQDKVLFSIPAILQPTRMSSPFDAELMAGIQFNPL